MKSILITGINGFIGSWLARDFIKRHYKVYGIGTKGECEVEGIDEYVSIKLPNRDIFNFIEKWKPNICIHCAGNANVKYSFENPTYDFQSSVLVMYELLDSIRMFSPRCKFVFLSSAAVYGNPQQLPIKEDCELSPISPYGYHKLLCEIICREFNRLHGLNIKIARIFSAYGEGLKRQVIWDICNKFKNDNSIMLYGSGKESRDFIHVSDIISAINIIVQETSYNFEVFNIGSGNEYFIEDLAYEIQNNFNIGKEIHFNNKNKEGDPVNWKADISKLINLGFKPHVNIREGIKNYVRWYKENTDYEF